jgi:hypothetical protein
VIPLYFFLALTNPKIILKEVISLKETSYGREIKPLKIGP